MIAATQYAALAIEHSKAQRRSLTCARVVTLLVIAWRSTREECACMFQCICAATVPNDG